ncbi:pleckstrin homology domain-containing family A member 5 isoform X13 [Zonotrichia leucophrys gambelii]|uniref:pleckstrin homology domain-containing family A member 5 isoform X13 n=1 Tax=Zonotrichia leucophrys gambelii TaxID=257770 RepID=UPI00314092A5
MAELSAERLRALPGSWSYGISQGGRVFFINEEAKSTTWLHPLTGEAVITGHRRSADLPTGWEEAYTFEGARYYVKRRSRSCGLHPQHRENRLLEIKLQLEKWNFERPDI